MPKGSVTEQAHHALPCMVNVNVGVAPVASSNAPSPSISHSYAVIPPRPVDALPSNDTRRLRCRRTAHPGLPAARHRTEGSASSVAMIASIALAHDWSLRSTPALSDLKRASTTDRRLALAGHIAARWLFLASRPAAGMPQRCALDSAASVAACSHVAPERLPHRRDTVGVSRVRGGVARWWVVSTPLVAVCCWARRRAYPGSRGRGSRPIPVVGVLRALVPLDCVEHRLGDRVFCGSPACQGPRASSQRVVRPRVLKRCVPAGR